MNPESQPLATLHVTLDRPRELRLSFRAMKRYATATGKDLLRDQGKALTTAEDFKALVWAMARESDPAVTQAQLAAHITVAVLQQVASAIRSIGSEKGPVIEHREFPN